MVTLGIIAEYNPFHNGHFYHLEKSRKDLQAELVIVVLGSSFLQRGEPALLNKWDRVRMALAGGVDLIIELPLPYACSSAEHFAKGGVAILESIGCDFISFGIEHDNFQDLTIIADMLSSEDDVLSWEIKKGLSEGLSYPAARGAALKVLLKSPKEPDKILKNPNNILAIEYLKAIKTFKTFKSSLQPYHIKRKDANYHDLNIHSDIASATAIRNILKNPSPAQISFLKNLMPLSSYNILYEALKEGSAPIFPQDLGNIILAKLRCTTPKELAALPDMETGLENRLLKASQKAGSWDELLNLLQTKRYAQTRLQRILAYFLLGLTEKMREQINFYNTPPYIRPLGFNKKGQEFLNKIKKTSKLPLITRIAFRQLNSKSEEILKTIELERRAANILALLSPNPKKRIGDRDFYQSPIIFP